MGFNLSYLSDGKFLLPTNRVNDHMQGGFQGHVCHPVSWAEL